VVDRGWTGLAPVLIRAFEAAGVDAVLAWILVERVRYVYTDPRHWRLYEDAVFALRLLSSLGWTRTLSWPTTCRSSARSRQVGPSQARRSGIHLR
jgi:hypothetical protein